LVKNFFLICIAEFAIEIEDSFDPNCCDEYYKITLDNKEAFIDSVDAGYDLRCLYGKTYIISNEIKHYYWHLAIKMQGKFGIIAVNKDQDKTIGELCLKKMCFDSEEEVKRRSFIYEIGSKMGRFSTIMGNQHKVFDLPFLQKYGELKIFLDFDKMEIKFMDVDSNYEQVFKLNNVIGKIQVRFVCETRFVRGGNLILLNSGVW